MFTLKSNTAFKNSSKHFKLSPNSVMGNFFHILFTELILQNYLRFCHQICQPKFLNFVKFHNFQMSNPYKYISDKNKQKTIPEIL